MISASRTELVRRIVAIGLTAIAVASAMPAAAEVMCPDTIVVTKSATAIPDWQVRDSGDKPEMERVTIYDGPPDEQASLKYDREITRKSEIVQFWNLTPNDHGYWLACGYTNISKELYRKLPAITAISNSSTIAANTSPTAAW